MSKTAYQGLYNAEVNPNYAMVMPVKEKIKELAGDVYDCKVKPVTVIAAATTLTILDSGKVFILSAAGGAAITLPAVGTSAGVRYKFITGAAFAGTAWTVVAATAKIQGGVIVNSTNVPAVNITTVTFAHAAESIGDWMELDCDGTNWYMKGVAVTAGAITVA
jgi:hypothetical protein